MNNKEKLINIPESFIEIISLEIWRLWRMVEKLDVQANVKSFSYSIKKMKDMLESQSCSFVDLTGELYDAGMAVDVIDTEGEKTNENSSLIIKDMISPIILLKGILLKHGQVVLEWKKH